MQTNYTENMKTNSSSGQKTSKAYIITTPNWGVYLGSCMGLGFWSKLDHLGLDEAATFDSEQQAYAFMDTWDSKPSEKVSLLLVNRDRYGTHASLKACVKAGAELWNPAVHCDEPSQFNH